MEYTVQRTRLEEGRTPLWTLSSLILVILTLTCYAGLTATPFASCNSITDTLFGNITVIREPV